MAVKRKLQKQKKTLGVKNEGEKFNADELLKEIQHKFGEGALMKLGETPKVDIGVIPTGSIGLDFCSWCWWTSKRKNN